jgi:hypothetical protein
MKATLRTIDKFIHRFIPHPSCTKQHVDHVHVNWSSTATTTTANPVTYNYTIRS